MTPLAPAQQMALFAHCVQGIPKALPTMAIDGAADDGAGNVVGRL
ncbi:hypothetical protein AB0B30_38405 [Streptomyces narbonensis]|uniref:Uncharacterized protein n=1 Tax=Streptomyces narbonensis TaxID=67333 RepID=A0ABV3CMI4_9ACTN